jgi:hypothetical protein
MANANTAVPDAAESLEDYKTPTTPPQHLLTPDTANHTTAMTCTTQHL